MRKMHVGESHVTYLHDLRDARRDATGHLRNRQTKRIRPQQWMRAPHSQTVNAAFQRFAEKISADQGR